MAQIFVSYKRHDKDIVFPIVENIKRNTGVDCWIDVEGIESGDQFQNVIIDAIDNSDIVIFMLSKNFIAPYVDETTGEVDLKKQTFPEKEVMYALRHGKRLVPISIDGTSVYDCKWLEFNCSGLDYVTWNDIAQRNKLMTNLRQWEGIGNNDIEEIGHDVITSPQTKERSFLKKIFQNKGCVITISIAFVLFLLILPLGFFSIDNNTNELTSNKNELADNNVHDIPNSGRKGKNLSIPDGYKGRKAQKTQSVDLGLPSGTLWANQNIGAIYYADYGELYSWGELETKEDYRQSCYKEINERNIIGTKYDVATRKLGQEWQMPSQEQFDELIRECLWKWEDRGFYIIGKNGNSIFLPASGWSCSSVVEHRNSYGYYWTGDKANSLFGKGLIFSKSEYKTGNGYLYYGRAVRAVRNNKN